MPAWPNFINGSYQVENFLADQEDTINFFIERMESPGALSKQALRPTPGFLTWGSVAGDVNARGAILAGSRAFMVIGASLYELFQDGTTTKRGTVGEDSNLATLNYNGTAGGQLFITSAGDGYCYTLSSNTLSKVLSGTATMGAFANDYFLAFNLATGNVQLSALQDGSSWPGQSFSRSLFADPWQAIFVDNNGLIWLPGTETFEVWDNTGASPQPFAPVSGLVGRYGIGAPFAWAVCGSQVLWLATNPEGGAIVIAPQQSGGTAVSNYAVAQALSDAQRTAKISDAEALSYQEGGHTFFILALPSVPQTWAFDVDQPRYFAETARLTPTGNWAKRGRWLSAQNKYDLWSPRVHLYAFGKHLVGDRSSGTIAEMTSTVAIELDGSGIRRVRQAPVLPTEYQRVPVDFVQMVCDLGLGVPTGQGRYPVGTLAWSDDGGRTFGNERQASAGAMGQWAKRMYWTRCGAGAMATGRFVMTDPIPWRITDCYLNNVEKVA